MKLISLEEMGTGKVARYVIIGHYRKTKECTTRGLVLLASPNLPTPRAELLELKQLGWGHGLESSEEGI